MSSFQSRQFRLAKRYVSLLLIAIFILIFTKQEPLPIATAYEIPTHREFNEIAANLVEHYDADDKYTEVYLAAHITRLRQGAADEDEDYTWSGIPTNCNDGRFMRHFYQPGQPQGANNGLLPPSYGARCTDALTWALSSANDPKAGNAGDLTWAGALDRYDYTDAAKEEAYLRVGHVAHLIGDMAQPDHVHVHPHPKQDYEPWAITHFTAPALGSMTIPAGITRLEDFLINVATNTYLASTFQGGPLAESATTPINPSSELAQMFNVTWVDHTWPADNTWELRNPSAAPGAAAFGDWDDDFGRGYLDNEWWETDQETGGGLLGAGFYAIGGDVFEDAVPAVYKGVPNTAGLTLADIYIRDLPPVAIEHIAGMYQFFHDIANHPPFVQKITVTQAGNCVYEQHWENEVTDDKLTGRTLEDDCSTPEDERWINGEDGPVEIEIEFGNNEGASEEKIKDVQVTIGNITVQGQLDSDETTWTGSFTPPSDGSLDGEQTIEIVAKDKHDHFTARNAAGDELDSDPATPAKAGNQAPYNWNGYEAGTDENHKVKIDTTPPNIRIRYRTEGPRCDPRYVLRAEVNDGTGAGSSGNKSVVTSGGSANPANDPETVQIGTVGVGQSLEYFVEAEDIAGNKDRKAARQPGPPEPPGCDHSDDNYSAAIPQFQVGSLGTVDDDTPRVAVLSNGFAPDASGFVNALREPNILVEPDFSPDIVAEYPLLVIPTGGLYGLETSNFFRATLEEYANRGGTIIVFDQQHGADYTVLPGGGLSGYGWAEDNSCTLSSLYIRNYDQVVSGFDDAILNSNVDGYFTDLPEDADILLHRTKNGQPAMVRYGFGSGMVIATTAYDDWGVTNWQTTADAYVLNRDLLAWAVDPALLPEFDPGDPISLPVVVRNDTGRAADSIQLTLLAPGKNIISDVVQSVTIDATTTTSVTFSSTAERPLGIWRVDYTLLDADGDVIQARQPGERFVVKDPHPLSAPFKDASLTVNSTTEHFISGTDGEFLFTVQNNTNISRTYTVRYGLPHHTWETGNRAVYGNFSDLSQTIVVDANSQGQFSHVFPMRTNDRLFAYLYEGGTQKDSTWFQTRKSTAVVQTAVSSDQREYGRNQAVSINSTVTNLSALSVSFNLDLSVSSPNGTVIYSDTRPIVFSGGETLTETFDFMLPGTIPNGTYRISANVYQGNSRVSGAVSAFVLPDSPARFEVTMPANLPATAGDPLQVEVTNDHAYLPVDGTLGVIVVSPGGTTITLPIQPYNVTAGQAEILDFDLTGIPAAFGQYIFKLTAADQYSSRSWQQTANLNTATTIQFDKASYRIRETLGMTVSVSNNGQIGIAPQVTVSIPDTGFVDTQILPLALRQTGFMTYSLVLPDTLTSDFHDVNVTVELGTTTNDSKQFLIPESRILPDMSQTSYAAGETAVVQLNNSGGVDGPMTATLKLVDIYGSAISTDTVTTTVLAGQQTTITLAIPAGAIDGNYYIDVNGRNTDTGAPINLERHLDINGVASNLTVFTGQPDYFSDEQLSTFADILMASGNLTDADLNLRICSANVDDGGDVSGPTRINYETATVPFNWIDIASGGKVVAVGSNTYTLVDLGFSFEFYGNTYSQLYIHSNGYVTFGAPYNDSSNDPIPSTTSPNNAIFALWDYLYPLGGAYGNIYAQQVDTNLYVIQWQEVTHCCGTSYPETFQIILDGSDNSITLQYQDVSLTNSATVGVENEYGSDGIQIAYNQAGIINDNLAIELTTTDVLVAETNYTSTAVPFDWVDIASGGQVVAQGANTYTQVEIGFPFQFYGITHTQMYVHSNGYLTFGSPYNDSSNDPIPNPSSPNNAIYALWDYLYPLGNAYGNIFVEQVDATHTVVQWQEVTHCCGTSYPETFQIVLDGTDHSITLQYKDVSLTNSATVGVENPTGTDAVQIAYNQAGIINDNMAIKLSTTQVSVPETNYSSTAVPFAWQDIASGGQVVARGSNTYSQVDLGFPFQFHGITYTQMYVHSNGYVTFDNPYNDSGNDPIPSPSLPNNAIYAFWDYLYPLGGDYGAVYAQQVAPDRYVVQWQEVTHCCSTGTPETFQIVLDGSDNSFTLQYLDVTSTGSATVGVEDSTGSTAVQVAFNQTDVLTDNLAIKFSTTSATIQETSYAETAVALSWQDISVTGAIAAQGDDTYSVINIGFPFQFYGITYTQMYVGSNGYVSFGAGYTTYSNSSIPSTGTPNNAIYALWTDLYPVGGVYGNVYTEQISPTVHIIQWETVSHCCSTGSPETFQVILDGSDHSITLQYEDITNSSSATVGVENALGTVATQIAYAQSGVIVDGAAFRLTPTQQPVQVTTYVTNTVPISWTNVAPESGTNIVALGQNTYELVELGFPFQFYGITHTQLYVGSNGFLSFENGYTNSGNSTIPSTGTPNNAIYAFWDYLYPIGGNYGQIYTRQISPTLYVVQWEGVEHCCSLGNPETFQVILDGSDNSITLQYEDISFSTSATVGVEDRLGVTGLQLSYNQSGIITDGSAYRLESSTQMVQVPSYITATVPISWTNVAPITDTNLLVGNNTYQQVQLGFPFQFYGITHTQMFIHDNGYVTFGSGYSNSSNVSVPSTNLPNNAIYGLWDYLYPIGGNYGQVYGRQISPTLYVVQWEGVQHCCSLVYPETFQIILDGSDNSITLQYEDVALTSSATVGVEDELGIKATQLSYNQTGVVVDGSAFKLNPEEQMVLRPSYISATIPISWTNIAPDAGTEVIAGQNSFKQVSLGFPFDFYGNTYTDAFVGTNGYITFGSGNTSSGNTTIPNFNLPNNAVFALWDYLLPNGGENGQIYGRQIDASRYVIQWQEVTHCCSGTYPETFQIILDGSDDTITLQYEDVALTSSATVGVENEFGTRGTQISYNQSGTIVDSTAIQLTAVEEEQAPPPICDPTQPQPINLMLVIDRSGSMGGQKIIDAKIAAKAFVDFLDLSIDQVGLVSFASSATLNHSLSHDGDSVKAAIDGLIASGGTAIGEGIGYGHAELLANATPGVTPVMVLLSDGVNGSGRDPITAANAAKDDGIRIVSIGLGSGADENLLRAIATSESDYHFAPASTDLEQIFESIANSICRSPLPYDASCGGYVLWEETVPVSVTTSLSVNELVAPLDTTGRLILDGRLYAETGQPLAKDQYPFYLHDRDTALTLETDQNAYRPGDTIQASGWVTNTSTLAVSTDLEVWADDTMLLMQPLTLAPGEGISYTTSLTDTDNLPDINVVFVAIANNVSVYRPVIVVEPEIEAELVAPAVAGSAPFQASLLITNTGRVPVVLNGEITGIASDSFTLAPGTTTRVEGFTSITQDTTLVAPITGDVSQTLTADVIYGEAAVMDVNPEPTYPVGSISIPYDISNTGLLAVSFDADVTLRHSNGDIVSHQIIPTALTIGGHQPGQLHFNDLTADTYTLTHITPFASESVFFDVIAAEQAALTAVAGTAVATTIPVSATVTNTGLVDINGEVLLTTTFFDGKAPVTNLLIGQSTDIIIPVDTTSAAGGDHPAQLQLLNQAGKIVDETAVTLTIPYPNLVISALPTNLTLPVSTTVTLSFEVTNQGGAAGEGLLSFTFSDIIDEEQAIWLANGETGTIDFSFFVPPGTEAKTYPAPYSLNNDPGILELNIEGVDIGVTPSLDKDGYYEGETAQLTLHIEELADRETLPLYALVRFNDYSEIQPFSLTPLGSTDVTFDVPVSFLGEDKVFYGIYDLATDASIHLNTIYLPRLYPDVTVRLDKQVYTPGETVIATVVTTATGQLDAVAPDFSGLIPLPGSNTTFSFTLPLAMVGGTYSLDSIPQNCNCLNEGNTLRTPFDVVTADVRITNAALDEPHYEPGDTIRLDLTIASDQAITTRLLTWIEQPDKTLTVGPEQIVNLSASPANFATTLLTLNTDQSGMHRVIYHLVDLTDPTIIHGRGAEVFDVGSAIIAAVSTDKTTYPTDSEPVYATVLLFATVPINGDLSLTVDDGFVYGQNVSLIAGFQEMTILLPGGYGRGEHDLRATLIEGGLASSRETTFDYATHGPDLIPREPIMGHISSGEIEVTAVIGNRGQEIAGPTTATLYDGDPDTGGTVITSFTVPSLNSGGSYETTVNWSVSGRSGDNLLVLVADANDEVVETNEANNETDDTVNIGPLSHVLTSDKTEYYRSDTALFTAELQNLDSSASLTNLVLETNIYQMNGTVMVAELYSHTVALADMAANEVRPEIVNWAIAPTTAEFDIPLLVVQRVYADGVLLSEQTLQAQIVPILVTIKADPEPQGHFTVFTVSPFVTMVTSETADIYYQENNAVPLTLYTGGYYGPEGIYLTSAQPQRNGIAVGPIISRGFGVDTLPPQTTAVLDPPTPNGANGTYNTDVVVTLFAQDAGVGLGSTFVSADATNWDDYTEPITATENGAYTLYYYSVDLAGNTEPVQSTSFEIDQSTGSGPAAVADEVTTGVDVPVTINVLANDSDPDNDPLSVINVGSPSHGTAVINLDNTITYTPSLGFSGSDVFSYTIADTQSQTDSALVTVVVQPPLQDWQYGCQPNELEVDIIGIGMGSPQSVSNPATLTVPDPENVAYILAQVVVNNYQQVLPDEVILTTDQTSHTLLTPTNSAAGYNYELVLPPTAQVTAEVVGDYDGTEPTPRAFILYIFRQQDNLSSNGRVVHQYVYHDTLDETLTIPAATFNRDVVITFAVADVDRDARNLILSATAGSVTRQAQAVQSNREDSLLLYELILPDVSAEVTSVTTSITSPTSTGDSLYWSGVQADTPCAAVTPPATRVGEGLQALYTFQEGSGQTVADVSGVGTPLDLTITDETAVTWLTGGGLSVDTSTIISSTGAATKLSSAAQATNELTLEAWVAPSNVNQDGPARILTLSEDTEARNFTLAQGFWGNSAKDLFDIRLRTTTTDDDGNPSLTSPAGTASTDLTHVVYTRDTAGVARLYVDGVEVLSGAVGGDFSNWDNDYVFALANELTGTRPWLGQLHLVAVYNQALTLPQVRQNYLAGSGTVPSAPQANANTLPTIGTAPLTAVALRNDSLYADSDVWLATVRRSMTVSIRLIRYS